MSGGADAGPGAPPAPRGINKKIVFWQQALLNTSAVPHFSFKKAPRYLSVLRF
jgi:hypothetical protein